MHREILGLDRKDKSQGDHVNLDSLDNTDDNLRVASNSQNQMNSGKRRDNPSGFKGFPVQETDGAPVFVYLEGLKL